MHLLLSYAGREHLDARHAANIASLLSAFEAASIGRRLQIEQLHEKCRDENFIHYEKTDIYIVRSLSCLVASVTEVHEIRI
jgi:hypothetical protein